MNFCFLEEEIEHKRFLLANLISLNFIYDKYNILIACSNETKEYILNFPINYRGNIKWLILEKLDDNNIRYAKNLLLTLSEGIKLFNEVIYIDCRINLINKIEISDDVIKQGIGFVSRSVGYMSMNIEQKYIKNILYLNNALFLEKIENLYSENISEWKDYDTSKYSLNELREINKCFVEYDIKILYNFVNKFDINYFLPHNILVSTEDFFAISDKLKLKDINSNWQIQKKFVKEKSNYLDIRKYEDLDISQNNIDISQNSIDISQNNIDISQNIVDISQNTVDISQNIVDISQNTVDISQNIIDEEDCKLVNICALNIRSTQLESKIIAVNKEMYSRMASYNIIYMLLINLKYAKRMIEFILPKRDGIAIWDRNNDPPGLYQLIDMITKDSNYFGKLEAYVDYFSFNNFILTDKPSKYWLNNNVRKYSGFFLCNHDDTLDVELSKIDKPLLFGFYYSDYPELLEKIAETNLEKSKFCIEILNNKIIEYELSKKKTSLIQKNVIDYSDFNEKFKIISESKFVLFDKIDVNLFANCFGLRCIPVIKNYIINNFINKNIYLLKNNENFIIESNDWNNYEYIYNKISAINYKLYRENIKHDNIIKNLLSSLFDISIKQFNS